MGRMKKIKNVSQLRYEKNMLRLKELEMEQAIRQDWKQLGEEFQPGNLFKNNSSNHPRYRWFLKFIVEAVHLVSGKILQKTCDETGNNSETSSKSSGHHFGHFFRRN